MFRKLGRFKNKFKNKKAQNTAEYALLISLVVAGIIAMQTYAQRALQARIRDASNYMATRSNALGSTIQYEPYYLESSYDSTSVSFEQEGLAQNGVASMSGTTNRTRAQDGFQLFKYDTSLGLANTM